MAFLGYLTRRGASRDELKEMLPDAISTWLALYHVLEPEHLSRSALGQVNRIRDERNRLAHGGFEREISHTSPDDVYEALRRPLNALEALNNA